MRRKGVITVGWGWCVGARWADERAGPHTHAHPTKNELQPAVATQRGVVQSLATAAGFFIVESFGAIFLNGCAG